MPSEICPLCGNTQTLKRSVNDRFLACDPTGEVFEVALQKPVWTCSQCHMVWERDECLMAKEEAYQVALRDRFRGAHV
jgi:ssDNA-binding Zn-finger/Zn-ribbon topoisomerase 1